MTQRKEQKQIPCVCDKHYIKEQLQGMGVRKGMVLLVQGKMEKLGKIIGGAQTLIDAIMEVIGYEGTLVMPAFTPYKKDPACLWDGKEYREQREQIRKGERPFDRKLDAPRNTLAAQFMRNAAFPSPALFFPCMGQVRKGDRGKASAAFRLE